MPDLQNDKLRKAILLVEKLLTQAGPDGVHATEVIEAGSHQGLTRWTMRTAREFIGATSSKETIVTNGRWFWKLPPYYMPVVLPPKHEPLPLVQPLPTPKSDAQPQRPAPVGVQLPQPRPTEMVTVSYRASCPGCGRFTATLTRQMEWRYTSDGERTMVGDSETRYLYCDECKHGKIADKRRRVERQITTLESEALRLAAADPTDPNIFAATQRIGTLKAELSEYERLMQNA